MITERLRGRHSFHILSQKSTSAIVPKPNGLEAHCLKNLACLEMVSEIKAISGVDGFGFEMISLIFLL
jgi:hypothetical protein